MAEGHRAIDWKTRSKSDNNRYDDDIQFTGYSLYLEATTGVNHTFVVEALVDQAKGAVRVQSFQNRNREDYQSLIAHLEAVTEAMRTGIVIGAYGHGQWWCTPKWCGYWNSCPFVPAYKK